MNWDTEIPLWGVISLLLMLGVGLGKWLYDLATKVAVLLAKVQNLESEMAGFREKAEQESRLWAEIRERLVRIETKLEAK